MPPFEVVETYALREKTVFAAVLKRTVDGREEYLYQIQEPVLSAEKQKLFERILSLMTDAANPELFDDRNADKVTDFTREILDRYAVKLPAEDLETILYNMKRDFIGFGPIQPLLDDPNIEDISCSGGNLPIYVFHRTYGSVQTDRCLQEAEIERLVRKMAQRAQKQISVAEPMADAVLPNGSRAHLTLGNEITVKGSTFTIRKFNEKPFLPTDLTGNGTFTPEMMAYLWLCVESNLNVMFAGGTASGKTTSLNAVCRFIPLHKKIVSIEDTHEISLPHENWIAGVSRETKRETGNVSLYDLLKAALRQRPEYILVGEIRGAEAYVLFQAMATGHATLSTMHAESVDALIHRLENPPMNVPRMMIQTLDVLAVLEQIGEGNRFYKKCRAVYEILETDPQTSEIVTREIFTGNETDEADETDVMQSAILDRIRRRKGWTKNRLEEEYRRRVLSFEKSEKSEKFERPKRSEGTKRTEGQEGQKKTNETKKVIGDET